MSEIRFSYNPFTKDFIESDCSHSTAIANKGKQKQFDEYIRGIIVNKKLYLRLFYPFEDISELSLQELKWKSRELLEFYQWEIHSLIRQNYKLYIEETEFNVENDLLQGVGLANI